jgi:hypothetical protein
VGKHSAPSLATEEDFTGLRSRRKGVTQVVTGDRNSATVLNRVTLCMKCTWTLSSRIRKYIVCGSVSVSVCQSVSLCVCARARAHACV